MKAKITKDKKSLLEVGDIVYKYMVNDIGHISMTTCEVLDVSYQSHTGYIYTISDTLVPILQVELDYVIGDMFITEKQRFDEEIKEVFINGKSEQISLAERKLNKTIDRERSLIEMLRR